MKELILGGVKSGKSRLGVERALQSGREVVYIATATAGDDEMQARIERHRRDRPGHWGLIEEPVHLSKALMGQAAPGRCVLVDCLTLWMSNLMHHDDGAYLREEIEALVSVFPNLQGHIILIANETGFGVMPVNSLARRFGDEAGVLHQRLAACSDRVTLVVAGLPLFIKGAEQ